VGYERGEYNENGEIKKKLGEREREKGKLGLGNYRMVGTVGTGTVSKY
jgi:hypothetical protein